MKKRLTIGVMIGNANSPYTKTLMRGIYDAAEKMDVNLIFFLGVHMTRYFREYLGTGKEDRYDYQYNVVYDYAHLSDVDGVIISYGSLCIFLDDNNKEKFIERFKDIPYVLVEDRDESGKGSSIISDNYQGMYQIVEHLIQVHECKKLCFVSGPDNNTDAEEREKAFRDAVAAYDIAFSEDMIARGDYSQCCGKQIGELLDRYPQADAIVCANDVMAETAYQECAKRGYEVGKDIAVTGYDDGNMAESMLPPLTTVLQNEVEVGYDSLRLIIELCQGAAPKRIMKPAIVKYRGSCGCKISSEYHFDIVDSVEELSKEEYVADVIEQFGYKVLKSQISSKMRKSVMQQMNHILRLCTQIYRSMGEDITTGKIELMECVNELFNGECASYISAPALMDGINEYVKHLCASEIDAAKIRVAAELAGSLQQFIQLSVITRDKEREELYGQDTMFVPIISQDMISHIHDEMAFFEAPMYVLNALRVKSAYLYVLESPRIHYYGEAWECPEKMKLVSKLEDGKSIAYGIQEGPCISNSRGVCHYFTSDRPRIMTALNLFTGKKQYGLLLVEIDPEDMSLMHLASMQISNALNFYDLYQQQMEMQLQLEHLVDEVNEKNKILSFVSAYDQLTGLLNRRGFMEKAMKMMHSYKKEKAALFIADLDHLKEINDTFGHVAGDFAISSAADILREVFGTEALAARIGGDEFLVLLPYNSMQDGTTYLSNISRTQDELNQKSQKEFYVELSVGYTVFECDEKVDFDYILSKSDEMLYEKKQARRKSVKKGN